MLDLYSHYYGHVAVARWTDVHEAVDLMSWRAPSACRNSCMTCHRANEGTTFILFMTTSAVNINGGLDFISHHTELMCVVSSRSGLDDCRPKLVRGATEVAKLVRAFGTAYFAEGPSYQMAGPLDCQILPSPDTTRPYC